MPDEEPADTQEEPTAPVDSVLSDLASKFAALLESEFIASVPDSTSDDSMGAFRQHMMSSFISSMIETGASRAEVAALLHSGLSTMLTPVDELWSDAKNDRRVELIDQSFQRSLAPDEAFELDQLTEQMRSHCDTEDAIPMQGARKLHEYLLGIENSSRDPN